MSQTLSFDEFNKFYTPEIMFEVSYKRSPVLKQIDELFRELKNNIHDRSIHKQLEQRIQEFSKIKKIHFYIQKTEYNAFVYPVYKENLPEIFSEIEKVKSDTYAEETAKYIKRAYIVFGDGYVDEWSPRTLTAVLLHELGHLYQHTANYSFLIRRMSFIYSRKLFKGGGLAMGVATLFNPAFLPLLLASFALSRTLTFNDHLAELDADSYAAKYGYAEELIRLHMSGIKWDNAVNKQKSWMSRMWDHLMSIILPSTHPSDKDRVCNMIEKMKDEHKKMYPKMKKTFNIIYADLKC